MGLLLAFSLAVTADTEEGPYTYTVAGNQATITAFSQAYSGALSITNTLGGHSVTTIGEGAFFGCTSLTSVTIPSSVTAIGDYAFSACSSLTNIVVEPANLAYTSVDGVLFDMTQTTLIQCPGGKSGAYTIPSSVTVIGIGAFADCASLTGVTVPSSVITIGYEAFSGCLNLTRVTTPASVTTIGDSAFKLCTSLASVTIPASATTIGQAAFFNCTSLQRVYFARTPPSVGEYAFGGIVPTPTLYYLPDYASSWPSTFADCDTKLWNPVFTKTAITDGVISCTVTGSPPIPIALEATTNLAVGPWVRLCTTNLTDNSIILRDPASTNYPARFYRIIGP